MHGRRSCFTVGGIGRKAVKALTAEIDRSAVRRAEDVLEQDTDTANRLAADPKLRKRLYAGLGDDLPDLIDTKIRARALAATGHVVQRRLAHELGMGNEVADVRERTERAWTIQTVTQTIERRRRRTGT